MEITCPVCNHEFEDDEIEHYTEDRYCPKCNAKYSFDFDCADEHDAVLIADFEYYYMSHEEQKQMQIKATTNPNE